MVQIVNRIEDANCITHSGTMHADEVFATAFLDLYLKDVRVFRTTSVNPDLVDPSVLVYDIGRGKFDHHQIDALKRDNGITYCSLGLLWKEFGQDFLTKLDYDNVLDMFHGIDKDLVEGIDADDNGVFPKIEAPYKVKTIPNIIKIFNPSYDTDENESEQFLKAVKLAKMIWEEEIFYIHGKVLADKRVNQWIEEADPNQKYLYLKEYLPYEDAVFSNPKAENYLYACYPSSRGGYAIKAISKSASDRSLRKPFPEEWAGLENEELERVSGIEGLHFCHTGRFIVTCSTIEAMYQVLDKICQ